MTQRESLTKPSGVCAVFSSATAKAAYPWQTRVVGRRMTGVPCSSESRNASATMAYASSGEEGSNTGSLEYMPNVRVSCSVCEEMGPGSSATTTTMPPFTPT